MHSTIRINCLHTANLIRLIVFVGFLQGCSTVKFSNITPANDARPTENSAILVARFISHDANIGKAKQESIGLRKFNKNTQAATKSHYVLGDTGNQSNIMLFNVKNNLNVVRISGSFEYPFYLHYQKPELVTNAYWKGKVSANLAFRIPSYGKVYYVGAIHLDKKGTMRVYNKIDVDREELHRTFPQLKNYELQRLKLKMFPAKTKMIDIRYGMN